MNILQMKNISYKADNQEILKNININVKPNDFLTIVGPSGSGKSTILKLMANLISATSGSIEFKNKNINAIEPTTYRKKVSYCFQQPVLFGQTVKDNLSFPYEIRNENYSDTTFIKALESVDLNENYLNKSINDLSGGEKQRVALLRNLAFTPDVLLLDEITAGLDEENKNIVQNLIFSKHKEGLTIVQVTHDKEEIDKATNVITVKGGHVVNE